MEDTVPIFPHLHAFINATVSLLLLAGLFLARGGRQVAHARVMRAAFGLSALFLASYLYYHFNYPEQKFQGQGAIRALYFFILITHIVLAVGILPFIFRVLWLARRNDIEAHRRLARKVWPLWFYVAVTGVLIYLMLYQNLGVSVAA